MDPYSSHKYCDFDVLQSINKKPKLSANVLDVLHCTSNIEEPAGLKSDLYDNNSNIDSEDDAVSEITPIKQFKSANDKSKYDILDNLFRKMYDGNRNNVARAKTNIQLEEELEHDQIAKIRQKPIDFNHNVSTSKIYPYDLKPNDEMFDDKDSRYHYIIRCLYLIAEKLSERDFTFVEPVVNDIFVEDCTLKTSALKEPVIGRHHIMENYRSLLNVCADFHINVLSHEVTISDTVVLTSQHIITGIYVKIRI